MILNLITIYDMIDHIEITPKLIIFTVNIFAWFWLIVYTIYRFGCFKKRLFSLLIFIYFSRAVARVSELIVRDFYVEDIFWMNLITNLITVYGFYILTARLVYLREKYRK